MHGVAVGVVAVRPAANLAGGMGLAALIQEGKVVEQIAAGCRAADLPDHVPDAVIVEVLAVAAGGTGAFRPHQLVEVVVAVAVGDTGGRVVDSKDVGGFIEGIESVLEDLPRAVLCIDACQPPAAGVVGVAGGDVVAILYRDALAEFVIGDLFDIVVPLEGLGPVGALDGASFVILIVEFFPVGVAHPLHAAQVVVAGLGFKHPGFLA